MCVLVRIRFCTSVLLAVNCRIIAYITLDLNKHTHTPSAPHVLRPGVGTTITGPQQGGVLLRLVICYLGTVTANLLLLSLQQSQNGMLEQTQQKKQLSSKTSLMSLVSVLPALCL